MEELSKAAMQAAGLTRQLVSFSRRQVAEPKTIAVNEFIKDYENMLRRLLGENIELVLSLDPEAGAFRADPGQMGQVLMNLAVNAKDAMPAGGKLVIETSSMVVDDQFARTHLYVSPGQYVVMTVTDTGTGMSAEVKSHLFEPFYTTKEHGKGTGLGLSTVYGIVVNQSSGSIWVSSEPGQGTTFKLFFPSFGSGSRGRLSGQHRTTSPREEKPFCWRKMRPGVRKYTRGDPGTLRLHHSGSDQRRGSSRRGPKPPGADSYAADGYHHADHGWGGIGGEVQRRVSRHPRAFHVRLYRSDHAALERPQRLHSKALYPVRSLDPGARTAGSNARRVPGGETPATELTGRRLGR